MRGFIVYPTYKNIDDETKILLFGKLENGQSFVTIHPFSPYFFIETSDVKKVSKYLKKFTVSKTENTNFSGSPVSKISSKNQTELNKLFKVIRKSVNCYESDIKPHYRFLMDNDLLGNIEIQDSEPYDSSEKVDRVYQNPEISKPTLSSPVKLSIASVDTEWDDKGNLTCIGIHSPGFSKTFMITKHKLKNVISCESESDCLEKFRSKLLELDPDIITGWNFIDFDLQNLKILFEKHKIPFDIGRTNSPVRLRIESNFFRSSSADIQGRIVLDALNLIRDPFLKEAPSIKFANFESYTLEDVSQTLLGKGKLLKGKQRHEQIVSLYNSNKKQDHQTLADYNLLDCLLVSQILEKTKLIELAVDRSQLTGMPLDRLSGSIVAFDSLYIREARKRGLVSPTSVYVDKPEKITGGYVQPSVPGIYHNVLILDFKSLYPSVLKTFNIDPASLLDKKTKGAIETPNKTYFKNQSGILPDIITKLHKEREKAKAQNNELASYALKITMNSFWGVLASPNCRYFNFDMANSITGFARMIIQLTAKQIEKKFKVPVIYSDTDSVFVHTDLGKAKANTLGLEIAKYINDFYDSYVSKNYDRESFLELEFEKQYLSMMIPKLRGKSEKGAKKRYAGLKEVKKDGKTKEEMEIVGLEAIRGDWTDAAQEFQVQLLDKVFHKKEITSFIKAYIKKLRSGSLDKKLMYQKSIRKNLSEYTKTTPPHVKAARKLDSLEGNVIQYFITTDGPEPKQKLKHKLDYDHYIDKQIKPIAQQILTLFNKDFDDLLSSSKQAKLF
ncbi:hypothetical protein CMI45_00360 [Candidatus Pacearchaeota archaeon]|nr:hypothetical protein [Candidatus Pacearchaeota archaeon]|tara:strand:- start:2853 stop:5207 length:2355 start_codon:yes stop_codon:yes gene_type:complete